MAKRLGVTELTPELAKKLVELRSSSRLFDTQIAQRCGIAASTLKWWLTKGLLENAEEPYASFAKAYSDAAIGQEDKAVDKVLEGHNGKQGNDWKAWAWWLERRHPKRWGNRVPETGPTEDIQIQDILLEAAERRRTLAELLDDPPPELVAALQESREKVLAVLNEKEPAEQSPPALPE